MALKYMKPKRTWLSVISIISVIGVMLGVAVLVIVLSVMSGFDDMWRDKILSFRLDAFNAFNTPNFATPVAAIGASTAGQITGTINDNRDLQGSVTLHF